MFNKKKKSEDPLMEEKLDTPENQPLQEQPEQAPIEAAATLSAEEKLQQENSELNDKYLRLFAEFDNYKRRTQKERIELLQTAGKDVVVSLLPVLDDFERAVKASEQASEANAGANAILEGILLVQSKLKGILSQKGLKEMESLHSAFDTDMHEAITKIPAPNEELKGKVIDVLEKGYTLNDKVIRFAKVVVGA